MQKTRKYTNLAVIALLLIAASFVFFRYKKQLIPASLPPAVNYSSTQTSQSLQLSSPSPAAIDPAPASEVNLNIPFTSQAPNQNWSLPYQQFCEEASTLMAASYIKNQPISSPSNADAKMLAIKDFEMQKFGFYEDTNAEETATILREHFGLTKVEVAADPTVTAIKSALTAGKAVLVPLAGRQLGNPYYQQPGPLYHMLVIKGYDNKGNFITNDPGTRHGADYIYKTDTVMNAIHDWNGGNVDTGRRVMIVVG